MRPGMLSALKLLKRLLVVMRMPRHYNAITDHVPIEYDSDLDEITAYFRAHAEDLRGLFERWALRPLESDDGDALIEQLNRRVTGFALDCNALPLRTPRQLMATVKAIRIDPEAFLRDVGRYDPEAVARVYGAYASVSVVNRTQLAGFEAGLGPAPRPDEIAAAAANILGDLEAEARAVSRVGGQPLTLQQNLAHDLARIFKNFGGRVTRVTRFYPDARPQYIETGPFHDFLELVLPPARPFAERAGFRLKSIRSLVSSVLKDRSKT